jgi:diguanylate cyclase (GGDEF)-like protein
MKIAIGLLLSALICFAEYRGDPSVPFLMVYFIPVLWMNWTVGWRAAMAIACLNVLAWIVITDFVRSHGVPSLPPMWSGFRALMYLGVSSMLCTFQRLADAEKKWGYEDPLTGLPNRRAFFAGAEREISRARHHEQPLTVALVDVDDFKKINDRWGHDQGDKVLLWVGKTLRSHLRSADLLARLGGDELAILLSDIPAAGARAVMEKVHDSLQESIRELGIAVSVSIGVVTFRPVLSSVEDMLRAADRQMYRVKQNGKNSLEYEVIQPIDQYASG